MKVKVFEINQLVLTLVHTILGQNFFGMFNSLMQTQKLESFAELTNGLFLQAIPALLDES